MLYVLSKVLWFFAQPSSIIALLLLWAMIAAVRRPPGKGLGLVVVALAALVAGGLSPLSTWAILPLEMRFPSPSIAPGSTAYAGIIVLGGVEDGRLSLARREVSLNEAAERVTEAAVLARKLPSAKLLFSGGVGTLVGEAPGGAESVAAFWRAIGIAPERILVEDRSRNTYENALYSLVVLKPKPGDRWLLVTSAAHMPRAMGVYRQAGFDVVAYPVDFQTAGYEDASLPFLSIPRGLRRLDDVAKEWVGLVAYYLLGRTSALFPGP